VYTIVHGIELIKELLEKVIDHFLAPWQTAYKLPNVSVRLFAATMKELIDTVGGVAGVDTAHADWELGAFNLHQ